MRDSPDVASATDTSGCIERAQKALQRMDRAMNAAVGAASAAKDGFTRQAATDVAVVLGNVRKSLHATGIVDAGMLGSLTNDSQVQTEIFQVIKEVEWRLRNMARNIHLRAETQSGAAAVQSLAGVIEALDVED